MAADGSHALLVLGFESDRPSRRRRDGAGARAVRRARRGGGRPRGDAAATPSTAGARRSWAPPTSATRSSRSECSARRSRRRSRGSASPGFTRASPPRPRTPCCGRAARRERVLPLHARLPGRAGAVLHRAAPPVAATRSSSGADQACRLRRDHRAPAARSRTTTPSGATTARGTTASVREPFAGRCGREGRGRPRRHHEPRRADRPAAMRIAVLGPGGVGGLLAGALERAGSEVVIVARESTAAAIAEQGLRVASVTCGRSSPRPRAVARLREPVDALIVATKAAGLAPALARIGSSRPGCAAAAQRARPPRGAARALRSRHRAGGPIRVEADRPGGLVVHTSPFLLSTWRRPQASAEPDAGARAALARGCRRGCSTPKHR